MKRWICLIFCVLCLYCFCFSVSAEKEEVSFNANYSLITPASNAYPDDGEKLTDGIFGKKQEGSNYFYPNGAYVGFNKNDVNANGRFSVVLDLGKETENLTSLTIGYLSEPEVNIFAPSEVSFSISSQRNGNYTHLGSIDTLPKDKTVAESYAKTLEISPATGRYVLVTITPATYTGKVDSDSIAPWTFIDEISVSAEDLPTKNATDDEANEDIPESTPDNEPNSPDDDKNQSKPENIPQTGDSSLVLGFTLLGIAAITMAVALFNKVPKNKF